MAALLLPPPSLLPLYRNECKLLSCSLASSITSTSNSSGPLKFAAIQPRGRRRRIGRSEERVVVSVCEHRHAITRLRAAIRVQAKAQTEQTTEQSSADDEVCELVNGFELEIGEGDDTFPAYLIQAIKNNNGAGIILLSDAYGYQSSGIRDFVYRLACFGYNVLVPDLFHGTPWSTQQPDSEFEAWRSMHPPERIAKDIDTSTEWLRKVLTEQEVAPSAFGVVGFSVGGAQALQTVARYPDTSFATAVCFYGRGVDPAVAETIKVPVLFISGDQDELSPVDAVKEVEKRVEGAQARIYPGLGHGFAHLPDTLEDDEAAEDAFAAMRHWLHDHLLTTTLSE